MMERFLPYRSAIRPHISEPGIMPKNKAPMRDPTSAVVSPNSPAIDPLLKIRIIISQDSKMKLPNRTPPAIQCARVTRMA
jgi:hypothetical protein